MKITSILKRNPSSIKEAVENPQKPERIPTGMGKSTVSNPAYLSTGFYSGDPAKFEFTRQQQVNYQAITSKLARYNIKLDYIGAGISRLGNAIFVATGPGVVWYKYEAGSTASAVNLIYVNGAKFKMTEFITMSDQRLDELFQNAPEVARLQADKDFFLFVSRITSESDINAISNFVRKNKSFIINRIISNTIENPRRMKEFVNAKTKLARLGIDVTWLHWGTVEPDIITGIVMRFNTDLTWFKHNIKYYDSIPKEFLDAVNQKLFPKIEESEPKLVEYFRNGVLRGARLDGDGSFDQVMFFYSRIGYRPKILSTNAIFDGITHESILKVIDYEISYITSNTGKYYAVSTDLIRRLSMMATRAPVRVVDLIYQALEERRKEIVSTVLMYTAVIGNTKILDELRNAPQRGLVIRWPELDVANIVKALNTPDMKFIIIKNILTQLKTTDSSHMQDIIRSLRSLGLDWPELAKIELAVTRQRID